MIEIPDFNQFMTRAPAGDLSTYDGPALVEETVYRTVGGRTIYYRRYVAGKAPDDMALFWYQDRIAIKSAEGVYPEQISGPLKATTLAEALAVYDETVQRDGKAHVDALMADFEAKRAKARILA